MATSSWCRALPGACRMSRAKYLSNLEKEAGHACRPCRDRADAGAGARRRCTWSGPSSTTRPCSPRSLLSPDGRPACAWTARDFGPSGVIGDPTARHRRTGAGDPRNPWPVSWAAAIAELHELQWASRDPKPTWGRASHQGPCGELLRSGLKPAKPALRPPPSRPCPPFHPRLSPYRRSATMKTAKLLSKSLTCSGHAGLLVPSAPCRALRPRARKNSST